ncbi:MAG: lipoate--protein ligase [Oscillospiraceae bacterium]|jgi:lipoate-protein ligase A|nr:lipoate--protein ligase [Oscillospiraceae bacterium]
MVYMESAGTDPYFNLALEEYVFERMDRKKEYFILWQNDNTIVVGKNQNTAEEINREFVEENGIRVVRRLSGGGAVYHDRGNLNFTFIVNRGSDEGMNFEIFTVPVLRVLEGFGVRAEFSGRNDITIGGKKFCGNAQYSRGGRTMHHGCIMLDSNLTNVSDALRVREAKFDSKSVKSVRSRVTTINENASRPIAMEDFKAALRGYLIDNEGLEPYEPTDADIEEISKLRDEKYATFEWNYGASPPYDIRREMKFPAGLVTVFMKAERARIKEIRFYGDFFGGGDLRDLERAMEGLALDKSLEKALEGLDVSSYMNGISAAELTRLLL